MKIEDIMEGHLHPQEYVIWLYEYKCKTQREEDK